MGDVASGPWLNLAGNRARVVFAKRFRHQSSFLGVNSLRCGGAEELSCYMRQGIWDRTADTEPNQCCWQGGDHEECELWRQRDLGLSPALIHTDWDLGKGLNFSNSRFPYLQNGNRIQ